MRTVMFPAPIHINSGDTLHINYTSIEGIRIDKMFHSFNESRIFDRVIVDECTKDDLDRFGISDGFIMVLGNKD